MSLPATDIDNSLQAKSLRDGIYFWREEAALELHPDLSSIATRWIARDATNIMTPLPAGKTAPLQDTLLQAAQASINELPKQYLQKLIICLRANDRVHLFQMSALSFIKMLGRDSDNINSSPLSVDVAVETLRSAETSSDTPAISSPLLVPVVITPDCDDGYALE